MNNISQDDQNNQDSTVVDFKTFRNRPDIRTKRVNRMLDRQGPDSRGKFNRLAQSILNTPEAKRILGES